MDPSTTMPKLSSFAFNFSKLDNFQNCITLYRLCYLRHLVRTCGRGKSYWVCAAFSLDCIFRTEKKLYFMPNWIIHRIRSIFYVNKRCYNKSALHTTTWLFMRYTFATERRFFCKPLVISAKVSNLILTIIWCTIVWPTYILGSLNTI